MFIVRKSNIEGKGLFTNTAISARRKMGELTGERISLREARRRVRGLKHIAIVEMNETAIDESGPGGGPFRYINHSCSPNAYIRIAYERVEFYSLRKIRAGEEITCDYVLSQHDGKLPCRCKSSNCRKFL